MAFFSSRLDRIKLSPSTTATQRVRELRYDCDGDALLVLVNPAGPACHTGERSCFYRSLE